MAQAFAAAIPYVAAAASSIAPALIGGKKGKETHLYKDKGGVELLSGLIKGLKEKGGNFTFEDLLPVLQNLSDNAAEYANSAYNYWLEDKAFEKQVNYNLKAMEREQHYNNVNMKQQYEYGLKNMAEQYKYDVAMQNRSYQNSLSLQNAQNDWSKMMSDTSHQREVADLRAAGLNPILSANGGANAYTSGSAVISGNTPNASMPSSSNPRANAVQKPDYAQAVQTLLNTKRVQNETAQAQANIAKTVQETKNLKNTKEGLLGQLFDNLQGVPEGITDAYPTGMRINYGNPISNAMRGFADTVKKSRFGSSLVNFLNSVGTGNKPHKSYEWNSMRVLNDLMSTKPSNDYIHTKYGDLIDIDKQIRSQYNVGQKIRSHR